MDEKLVKGAVATLSSGLDIAVQKGSYKRQDVVVLDKALSLLETFVNNSFATKEQEKEPVSKTEEKVKSEKNSK